MKNSQLLTCPICGKETFARGLKNHIRLQHKSNLTPQVNEVKKIDYEDEPETYEELRECKEFYHYMVSNDKAILKFVAWVNEKNGRLEDMPDILKHFCIFLMNRGRTESEVYAGIMAEN